MKTVLEHVMTPMTDPAVIKTFTLAGKAHVTIKSLKTEQRFTYLFTKMKGKNTYFLSLLTGSDNENSYTYLGMLLPSGEVRRTHKSSIHDTAPGMKAARFFCSRVLTEQTMPKDLEVWHEGRCGRCNRLLTDPESIARGIGPECVRQMAGT